MEVLRPLSTCRTCCVFPSARGRTGNPSSPRWVGRLRRGKSLLLPRSRLRWRLLSLDLSPSLPLFRGVHESSSMFPYDRLEKKRLGGARAAWPKMAPRVFRYWTSMLVPSTSIGTKACIYTLTNIHASACTPRIIKWWYRYIHRWLVDPDSQFMNYSNPQYVEL